MNIFARIKRFFSSFTRPKPARDWLLLLFVSAFVFILSAAYAVYLYIGINSGAAFSGSIEVQTPRVPLTQDELDSLFNAYQSRRTNFMAHSLTAPSLIDPTKAGTSSPKKL